MRISLPINIFSTSSQISQSPKWVVISLRSGNRFCTVKIWAGSARRIRGKVMSYPQWMTQKYPCLAQRRIEWAQPLLIEGKS